MEDGSGRLTYTVACAANKVIPVSFVVADLAAGKAVLGLNHHGIGVAGCLALAEALKVASAVTKLRLADNAIGPGVRSLCAALVLGHLTEVDLSDNGLGKEGADAVADALAASTCALHVLSLRGNRIGDRGVAHLCSKLTGRGAAALESLDLSKNEIGEPSGSPLGGFLARNKVLRTLHLGWNALGSLGGRALLAGLRENDKVTTLTLEWNGLAEAGGGPLSEALSQNVSLTHLDLTHNRIGDKQAKAFARALTDHRSIKTLVLAGNNIQISGAQLLLGCLNESQNLQTIDLTGNLDPQPAPPPLVPANPARALKV